MDASMIRYFKGLVLPNETLESLVDKLASNGIGVDDIRNDPGSINHDLLGSIGVAMAIDRLKIIQFIAAKESSGAGGAAPEAEATPIWLRAVIPDALQRYVTPPGDQESDYGHPAIQIYLEKVAHQLRENEKFAALPLAAGTRRFHERLLLDNDRQVLLAHNREIPYARIRHITALLDQRVMISGKHHPGRVVARAADTGEMIVLCDRLRSDRAMEMVRDLQQFAHLWVHALKTYENDLCGF